MSVLASNRKPLWAATSTTSVALAMTATSNFSSAMPSYCESQVNQDDDADIVDMPFSQEVLDFDHYNGVTIKVEELLPHQTMDPTTFAQDLERALVIWKAEGKKGVWIHVPTAYSHLIPRCIQHGFDFHTAKPGLVILRQWLPTEIPDRLPNGPTHQVGIGAMVIHPTDKTKMLVVQEKTGPAAARKLWKMPTGLLDIGEDIAQAAVRELQEETGLQATFRGILCFRQAHTQHGVSDMFFVCQLQLVQNGQEQQQHEAQQEEIADIAWMSMEEYASQEVWQTSPLYKRMNDAMIRAAQDQQHYFVENKHPVGFRPGSNSIYLSKEM